MSTTQRSFRRPLKLCAHLYYIMIESAIGTISEMFAIFPGFSGSLNIVINHG